MYPCKYCRTENRVRIRVGQDCYCLKCALEAGILTAEEVREQEKLAEAKRKEVGPFHHYPVW